MQPQTGANVLAGKVGIPLVPKAKQFAGLACDSRQVKAGFLFAALPGAHANGAAYISEAARRGAAAILGRPDCRASADKAGVPFIADANPRRRLALIAAEYFDAQPRCVAAVTGTNGKTSVCVFLRQIWTRLGKRAASMGTIGVVAPDFALELKHTTPDPIALHEILARLKSRGIDNLALEASSHGLDQFRLDGVRIAAAAFTNITRDHLDYHPDFGHYLGAKLRLFSYLLDAGGVGVVNADAAHAEAFMAALRARNIEPLTVGAKGTALRLIAAKPGPEGQRLLVELSGREYEVLLPLAGSFQASNALTAAALAIGLGDEADAVIPALEYLVGAPGRLQKVALAASGAPIYVDYAHTPDALANVLTAIRPHVGGRLRLVFGCGGDRDPGKRALMGGIAAQMADEIIVTDDNPRGEDPAIIRRAILVACPGAREIGDRAEAIGEGVSGLNENDCLIVAGKGHETGQIIGATIRPFSDAEEAVLAARAAGGRAMEGVS